MNVQPAVPVTARRKWIAPLGAAIVIAALAALLWWGWNRPEVQAWKEDASPLAFFAAMALLPAIGMPITPFFILAGATFGSRAGLLGSAAALAINLTLCHSIARGELRPRLAGLLTRLGYSLPDVDRRGSATRFTFLVKIAPGLPAFAKNYLLGVVGVPFTVYFVVSMLITGAYGAALVVLGQSVLEHDLSNGLLAAAAIALAAGGVWLWRRRRAEPGLSAA